MGRNLYRVKRTGTYAASSGRTKLVNNIEGKSVIVIVVGNLSGIVAEKD